MNEDWRSEGEKSERKREIYKERDRDRKKVEWYRERK